MTSIRATLLVAGAAALMAATAASAQPADRGQRNSDGTRGLRSYAHMIGDTTVEGSTDAGGALARASAKKTEAAVAVAEIEARTSVR